MTRDDAPGLTVSRAPIEQVQPLAADYQREVGDDAAALEPGLPAGGLYWMARGAAGEPLGYAAGTLRAEGLVLGPVYVHPVARRRGVGTRLLHTIESWARGASIPIVEVSVTTDNDAGTRFLGSVGFVVRRHLMTRVSSAPSAAAELEEAAE